MKNCHACKRELHEGTLAWADDWFVVDENGARTEVRYICDPCEERRTSDGVA